MNEPIWTLGCIALGVLTGVLAAMKVFRDAIRELEKEERK